MMNALKRAVGLLPPKDFLKDKLADFTPDVLELEAHGFQRIFVADELMDGHRKNFLINDWGACIATAFSFEAFTNILHKLGSESYPVALQEKVYGLKQTFLKGELHFVRSSQIKHIDRYKTNGQEFLRKRIKLVIPHRNILQGQGETDIVSEQELTLTDAWAYLGNISYFEPFIDAGYYFEPVNTFQPNYLNKSWLGEFAFFTHEEYQKR